MAMQNRATGRSINRQTKPAMTKAATTNICNRRSCSPDKSVRCAGWIAANPEPDEIELRMVSPLPDVRFVSSHLVLKDAGWLGTTVRSTPATHVRETDETSYYLTRAGRLSITNKRVNTDKASGHSDVGVVAVAGWALHSATIRPCFSPRWWSHRIGAKVANRKRWFVDG